VRLNGLLRLVLTPARGWATDVSTHIGTSSMLQLRCKAFLMERRVSVIDENAYCWVNTCNLVMAPGEDALLNPRQNSFASSNLILAPLLRFRFVGCVWVLDLLCRESSLSCQLREACGSIHCRWLNACSNAETFIFCVRRWISFVN
jgi:hypothetical protein